MLPRDIDLTRNLDFNKKEREPRSIRLTKTQRDTSYKRYNEYANETTHSTISYSSGFEFPVGVRGTRSTGPLSTIEWNTIKVEEKICFRKLYKDPKIYSKSMTLEETIEHTKDLNFAMGSRYDRQKIHYEKLKMMEDFCAGCYCDCCGQKLNKRNCLTDHDCLCQRCITMINDSVHSIRL